MNYVTGSEWHKWDLHIHTPVSHINNYTGKDLDEKWENFIQDLEKLPPEFKVIGINDYLFIDGYEKVVKYKAKGRLKNIDTIFPIIEFRIKKFGGHKEFKRVNFHVIFSDKLDTRIIRQQFLNQLYGKYKLAPGNEGIEWYAAITPESLADLGSMIKATIPESKKDEYGSDMEEGFNNINFDEEDLIKLLKASTYLKNNFLTAIGKTEWDAFSWNDNSIAEKKNIINSVDFVFISSETIDAFNKAKEKLEKENVTSLLLDCSDSHHYSTAKSKDRIGKCFTWIKADTTFEGLKQVGIETDRLYVGALPILLERLKISPNKFIKSIIIDKVANSNMAETWYKDFNVELNPSLVAIIGNKGNGKSALTDILGLVGNSYNDNYSFLTKSKFRNPKPFNKASNVEAKIVWVDGSEDGYTNLNSVIDLNKIEKVKYIPQNFLETLCANEDEQGFEEEIKKIIFSHTACTDRLGFTNLDELINYKTEIINKELGNIKGELDVANKKIIQLERKSSKNFRQGLEEGLKNKNEELKNCDLSKPVTIVAPSEDSEGEEKNKELNNRIVEIRKKIELEKAKLIEKSERKSTLQLDLAELTKIKQAFEITQSNLKTFVETQIPLLNRFSLDVNDILTYKFSLISIDKLLSEKTQELTQINIDIFGNNEETKGIEAEISELSIELSKVEERLDEPYRLYQKYLQDLANWESRRSKIIGTSSSLDSIKYFEDQIKYLDEKLNSELDRELSVRNNLIKKLFNKKSEIIQQYKLSYKPITDFIEKYGHLMNDYQINLTVEFTLEGFIQKFFDHISQGAKGTYIGVEEGNRFLSDLASPFNINESQGLIDFLSSIRESLFFDKRSTEEDVGRDIEKQLKKGYTIDDLYKFLYDCDYLKPIFKLNLADKSISSLSPGERGALLLIFYLFLDKDDKPLIIDQPEENLDNQSVYKYLVHFIKEAKQKRQIIIVTHNPNLAVVCDAEQIIHMTIDKNANHAVSCEAGAIENPVINKVIVDILEGTKPAFKNRTNKYSTIFS